MKVPRMKRDRVKTLIFIVIAASVLIGRSLAFAGDSSSNGTLQGATVTAATADGIDKERANCEAKNSETLRHDCLKILSRQSGSVIPPAEPAKTPVSSPADPAPVPKRLPDLVSSVLSSIGQNLGTSLFVLFAAVFYFMPAFIAAGRYHRNRNAIAIMNLLLGWTGLGWVMALIWAFTANTERA
jgi:hypothetical protein